MDAEPTISTAVTTGGHAWRGADLDLADLRVALTARCRDELDAVAEQLASTPRPIESLRPDAFALSGCARLMAEVRARLDRGPGLVVLDRVPLDGRDVAQGKALAWLLMALLGTVVEQKVDGARLYDVRDTGRALGYGVRRSITNLEQEFHTDGGWLTRTPETVGLFCLQPAAAGGISRAVSLVTAHETLRADAPALLRRLYRPFWWDRQAEHAADEPKVSRHPVFAAAEGGLQARCYTDYVIKGQQLAGEPLDAEGRAALAALRTALDADAMAVSFRLERGQFQLVDNRRIAHARTAFEDPGRTGGGRHLLRLWARRDGTVALEGGAAAPSA